MDFVSRAESLYSVTEFRVIALVADIKDHLKAILVNIYNPVEIKMQVTQKDIFKINAMSYLEEMDAYTLMDTKIMDRIMKELWHSQIDVSGNILDQSTCYNIWNDPDEEPSHRFYKPRDLVRTRAHSFLLRVWAESI
jgi:hypothetical protein